MELAVSQLEERAARVGLEGIASKVLEGTRLDAADGLALYQTSDLPLLGLLADHVRERMHGETCFYNVNIHVNYTNWCNRFCGFCAFQRRPGEEGAYCFSPEEVEKFIRDTNPKATEVHMVGGVWPALGYEYFLDILKKTACLVGNSSAGIKECSYLGIPVVNIGSICGLSLR